MESALASDTTVIRQIAQNVTEHLQEDEKDSFLLAYALVALVICLILSFVERNPNELKSRYYDSAFVVSICGPLHGHWLLPPKVHCVQALIQV
mgnify:CR=1 FL=1